MEFLEANEIIKKTRKHLNMAQQDFEDDSMTRSYFGMIENGKRKINAGVANKIVEKFQKRAAELNTELNITVEELLRTPLENIEVYCFNSIKGEPNIDEILRIIDLAKEYNLISVLGLAYKLKGDKEYDESKLKEAFHSYKISLDNYMNANQGLEQPYLYNRMAACKYLSLEYNEAILYFERAYHYSSLYNDLVTEKISISNLAICYRKVFNYEEAIRQIDKYIEKYGTEDINRYINNIIVKANCLVKVKNFDDAIKIYKDLCDIIPQDSMSILGNVYNNLGSTYLDKNDYVNSLYYFNKSQDTRTNYDKKTVCRTIIDKSEVYSKQGFYNEALVLLDLGVSLALTNDDREYLARGYNRMIDIYSIQEDYANEEECLLKLADLFDKNSKSFELVDVYIKLQNVYIKMKNNNKFEECFKMAQSYVEFCCGKSI